MNHWSKNFKKSFFYFIKKDEEINQEIAALESRIIYDPKVNDFHSSRKKEFILGRVCASKAYEKCFGNELLELPTSDDRSPLWPMNVIGSISHDDYLVGAAVARSSELVGLGFDFEVLGRTKLELSAYIRSPEDLKTHPMLSDEDLLTLIFSCKESLYKALYPSVKKYFGFKSAAIESIDVEQELFVIKLLTDLNDSFGPKSRNRFVGRFTIYNKNCLTVLEIDHH